MQRTHALKTLLGLTVLLLAIAGTAAGDPPIATVKNYGDALVFFPEVEYNRLVLTVTGPCGYQFRQVVEEGEGVWQLDGTTIDGVYRANLIREEAVDPGVVKVLRAARANFDEETPKQLCRDGKLPAAPISQTVTVLVAEGKIIWDPDAQESRGKELELGGLEAPAAVNATKASPAELGFAYKDFVINDDLIVDGSACIGFDCVNGEVFSFDTIRLKENNLRIKFDDTSVVPSFPANDWQLTANESANGGASKFSIEDVSGSRTPFTVEANARSHSLYVDDGGRIGSRTSTPSVEIHTIDGDTPTLRLQQDGSSGFEPQTWDVAGNETNFFIRDVTNGSQLPFRIRPDAPTNSIFIDVDGDVGFGTSSPDAEGIHVVRSTNQATARNLLVLEANGPPGIFMTDVSANDNHWEFRMTSGGVFRITDVAADGTGDGTTEFDLNPNGNLTIAGEITTSGSCSGGCDLVFDPDYDLPSIEEHAEEMWTHGYLPSVGATSEDGPFNLSLMTGGMLNELEKAHIYIEQLHDGLKQKDGRIDSLQERLARLEALVEAAGIDP